jgi:hypothetical protein
MIDFYDFLQISPKAEGETIHRVYHFLAARYHPDNQKSGDVEKFRLLKSAYDVLSNPARRAEYDSAREDVTVKPFSTMIDFLDNIEGELNRRVAVLAVLYYKRRINPDAAEVSLREIEERMGFPRDYLDFTLWYLHQKGYIRKADNAQFTLTASGVDFVETERAKLPILNKLLEPGIEAAANAPGEEESLHREEKTAGPSGPGHASHRNISTIWAEYMTERRRRSADRRVGAPDLRENKVERRSNRGDRRAPAPKGDVS